MKNMRRKKGAFAARAHSFKENFLDALKNTQSSTPNRKSKERSFIQLAKKTGSTDNLTGHLGTARSTDCLIKEVQFALKYFHDVVSKHTFEMLPGCATVVLETVLAIQAFAGSIEDPMDSEVKKSLDSAFRSVSVLTSWADTVIVSGEVEATDTVMENIIEPVRKSVIVVVNLLSGRIGNKNLTRGSSLPDITSETMGPESSRGLSLSSDSILDISPVKPPLLPKVSSNSYDSAPPLPPKHLKPRLDRRLEDLISRSYSFHQGDSLNLYYGFSGFPQELRYGVNHGNNKSLPVPDGPETTMLDQSLDFMDFEDSPYNLSKESVNNISFDETDTSNPKAGNNTSSRSWSSKERSNASSPSFESYGSFLSDHVEREHPPAIPRKHRETPGRRIRNGSGNYPMSYEAQSRNLPPRRKLSEYDNVFYPEKTLETLTRLSLDDNLLQDPCLVPRHDSTSQYNSSNQFELRGPTTTWSKIAESRQNYIDRPPPLPPKKRNVMSYMEMFGKTILPSGEDILHGFFHTHDLLHNVWQHNFHEYSEYAPAGLLNFPLMDNNQRETKRPGALVHSNYVNHTIDNSDLPPALPPKRSRSRPGSFKFSSLDERPIPILREDLSNRTSEISDISMSSNSSSEVSKLAEITKLPRLSVSIPIERVKEPDKSLLNPGDNTDMSVLDSTDVSHLLVYGSSLDKTGQGGTSELRAGTCDALIVLATQTIKNDFLYQEAFLTTYRTFISTESLVDKLVYRYRFFGDKSKTAERTDSTFRRASRAAFSLLVRVVDGLADVDFQDKVLLEKLTQFITCLIENGNLGLARALRSQFILKFEERRTRLLPDFDLASMNSINRRCTLLNFKSSDLAEQMTLLDSNLFLRIDSAELLNWVQEQAEEKSPNLTKFTEHFNNMSYWTRTLILNQPDARERERYVMKFIKMMKWLRKMNNFNSYLALLSALDSAPIRRLEWQKNITEGLKEYCSLIDSSSSFRAYRSALAEAVPPCIPYIGLVLQDLTFVHIGNPESTENKINFAKRWQQFNILDNMRRFKKVQYHLTRHEEIIQFFGEFDDFLTEDEMWSISESIKPRGQVNKVR